MPRPVMRRFEVPLSIRLDDLHLVIQQAMGWENRHRYEFRDGDGTTYGAVAPQSTSEGRLPASQATLGDICQKLNRNLTFEYRYDFRDEWIHRVKVQGVEEAEPDRAYPHLISATRRCPPEDCGGPWGYRRYLESVSPTSRSGQAEPREEWEEEFDPETVDEELIRQHFEQTAGILSERRQDSGGDAG